MGWLDKFSGMLTIGAEQLEKASNNLAMHVEREKIVQDVIAELRSDVFLEQLIINRALEKAEAAVELDLKLKDPQYAKVYSEALEFFTENYEEKSPGESVARRSAPCFDLPVEHADPEMVNAIRTKIGELKEGRVTFLKSIKIQLAKNKELEPYFMKGIAAYDGDHYLPGILNAISSP